MKSRLFMSFPFLMSLAYEPVAYASGAGRRVCLNSFFADHENR